MARAADREPHVERPGPAEFRDPVVRREMQRAAVWFGMALLDRRRHRARPAAAADRRRHGLRRRCSTAARACSGACCRSGAAGGCCHRRCSGFAFIGWVFWYAGTTIAAQSEALRVVVTAQVDKLMEFGARAGAGARRPADHLGSQLLGSVGRLTSAVGSALGAITSVILMIVIGIFIAIEPRIYDRGIAWMLPIRHRDALLPDRRPCRLDAPPAAVRPAARHDLRGLLHWHIAVVRRACRWRRCSA